MLIRGSLATRGSNISGLRDIINTGTRVNLSKAECVEKRNIEILVGLGQIR